MRILTIRTLHFTLLISALCGGKALAQTNTVTVAQDSRFEELLNDKRKISSSITVNDRYKVQIFYGDNDKARKALQDFKKDYKGQDGTIIFESPTYKVWVGSYKTRIEAEKNLTDIRKKFPHALLVKPNK
ncbi:sporulation protein [Flavobacterium rivuli WB 3.3-2 = DSM 21788]|uniref:Sporulation protein n=1 Tax=Flavobacterium rivuli WB 3.3-2 = DSM 21788 TaxID=1121895 RepID=A0A0A2M5S2_9FLAO|nr:sporulation protein [Flavobacterium rivuli]KGO88017.1 sporulation protein [Flavobacterium rivuli WB 3.3-2 = DSM 21788]